MNCWLLWLESKSCSGGRAQQLVACGSQGLATRSHPSSTRSTHPIISTVTPRTLAETNGPANPMETLYPRDLELISIPISIADRLRVFVFGHGCACPYSQRNNPGPPTAVLQVLDVSPRRLFRWQRKSACFTLYTGRSAPQRQLPGSWITNRVVRRIPPTASHRGLAGVACSCDV